MKKKIIALIIIVSCVLVFFTRYKMVNMYLTYRYPSPIKFHGLTIPIEKGFVYSSIKKKGIRITDPLHEKYSIYIVTNFTPPHGDSFDEYLEKLGRMIVKVDNLEHSGIRYVESLNVDQTWWLNVSLFFPYQKIMVEYRGTEKYYNNFKKILDYIYKDMKKENNMIDH